MLDDLWLVGKVVDNNDTVVLLSVKRSDPTFC